VSPEFRKVALIAAALGLLLSLFLVLRPGGDDETATTTAAATTTAPATTATGPSETTTTAPEQPDVVKVRIVVGPEGVTSARKFSV
jgi:hypothetical protein